METISGTVLRILPVQAIPDGETPGQVVDLIIADERQYWRVSLWDDKPALVTTGALAVGDDVRIEHASPARAKAGGERRLNAGRPTHITKIAQAIEPLRDVAPAKLTVLAVTRPEGGKVCVAGIDEHGFWLRPQYVYESELLAAKRSLFKNRCVSTVYLDRWRGRRPRKEDRFFVYSPGVERELPAEEQRAFLELHVDTSVDAVFRHERTLGLIKPRILQVYEERAPSKQRETGYEQYIRFNFKDSSGRLYRRWPCRCIDFYDAWNALKRRHRWTCGWRMLRYLQKNETYLAIGLTHTDYGRSKLEYGAYPMIVGVHVVHRS
ncbi:MAG: hypothetical protein JW945_05975 [Methanomicrobia archaeon]|nr:hypothetical protein [Methanomicrobia archaeon]